MNKIGILGSGVVARALGAGFLKNGYQVILGTSDPSKLADWINAAGQGATIGTFEQAAAFGEMLVLAVKGEAAEAVLDMAGMENINDKTIIDTTNPIDHTRPPVNGVLHYFTSLDESLMEILQKKVPGAHFVKAFSIVGNAYMVDPNFPGGTPTMFICGNNENAKNEVKEILNKFGWETEDLGKVEAARAIEPLCILWCIPGMLQRGWNHAFKLLRAG